MYKDYKVCKQKVPLKLEKVTTAHSFYEFAFFGWVKITWQKSVKGFEKQHIPVEVDWHQNQASLRNGLHYKQSVKRSIEPKTENPAKAFTNTASLVGTSPPRRFGINRGKDPLFSVESNFPIDSLPLGGGVDCSPPRKFRWNEILLHIDGFHGSTNKWTSIPDWWSHGWMDLFIVNRK